jgi:hypothetical protein
MKEIQEEIARLHALADSGSLYAEGKRDALNQILQFIEDSNAIH